MLKYVNKYIIWVINLFLRAISTKNSKKVIEINKIFSIECEKLDRNT